jgi:glycosyltransferase involved in cell wall biosynthesis
MKVLFLYDFPLWGSGSGKYTRYLVEELQKKNYEIGIISPEKRRLNDSIKQYMVNPPQIPTFVAHPEIPTAKRYSELSDREITEIYKSYLDTTIEALSNFQPDIIHVQHLSLITWVARYIKALKGIRYVITSHGSDLYFLISDKRYLGLTEDAVRNAKALITVSRDTKNKITKIFGTDKIKQTFVVPGGVNINAFPNQIPDDLIKEINQKYNLEGKKVILFSGRLISHKGVQYLVQAAKDIQAEVVIVGEGPQKDYLLELVTQKNLKNVHFIGYLTGQELHNLYYRADIFVAPSVWDEPLGLSILEAMAAKTPVIATRRGGIPMLIKENYNGIFVPVRNVKKIAEACNKLLLDEQLRLKMAENARKTVVENFTWRKTALLHHNIYQKIIGNKPNNNK